MAAVLTGARLMGSHNDVEESPFATCERRLEITLE